MRRKIVIIAAGALLFAGLAGLAGCKKQEPPKVEKFSLRDYIDLEVGRSREMPMTIHPYGSVFNKMEYRIENPDVISFDLTTRHVTGLAVGSSRIWIGVDGLQDSCRVHVAPAPPAPESSGIRD